jgi:hypothetical protein
MNMSENEFIADLMRKIEALESTPSTFLTPEDIAILTGRKSKSRQIETLRIMGVPFFVSGTGHPVVARSAVDSAAKTKAELPKKKWVPNVLK